MTDLAAGLVTDELAGVPGGVNLRQVAIPGIADGRIARGGSPTWIEPSGARQLVEVYGIRSILDLRSDAEVERYGEPEALVAAGIRWLRVPLTGYPSTAIDAARPEPASFVPYFHGMLEASAGCWPSIIEQAASAATEPFLVACYCGKDRTGVVIAVLATLAGASRSDVAADYARSALPLQRDLDRFSDKWIKRGHTKEDWMARVDTKPATMARWLQEVEERHESMLAAVRAAGARPEHIEALIQALRADALEP